MEYIYALLFVGGIVWTIKREKKKRKAYFEEKEKQPKVRIRL